MQQLQRELAQLRAPKQEPVDIFSDPDKALQQRFDPFDQRMQSFESKLILRASKAEAIAGYGRDAVTEMEKAVEQAMVGNHPDMPLLAAQMRSSDDPVGVAMQWHRRETLVKETGGDPAAYKQRLRTELLKDPTHLARAVEAARTQAGQVAPGSRPNIDLPPSLNKAPGKGTDAPGDEAEMTDASLYKYATTSRRRA